VAQKNIYLAKFGKATIFCTSWAIGLLLLVSGHFSNALAVEATNQDYQNLILDPVASSSVQLIKNAFGSLDKIFADQLILADKYKAVIKQADENNALRSDHKADLSVYRTVENREGVFAREYPPSYGVSIILFETYEMRNAEYGGKGNARTTNISILQSELDRLFSLSVSDDHNVASVAQKEILSILQKYDSALSSSLETLRSMSKASIFTHNDRIVVDVLRASIYKLAVIESLSPSETTSRTALTFFAKIKELNLSPSSKKLIESGLLKAQNYSGTFGIMERGGIRYIDAKQEIDRRNQDPSYKQLFDKVFADVLNRSANCGAVLSR
jgi:hypothetical protein